jgi:hypothetical protein
MTIHECDGADAIEDGPKISFGDLFLTMSIFPRRSMERSA